MHLGSYYLYLSAFILYYSEQCYSLWTEEQDPELVFALDMSKLIASFMSQTLLLGVFKYIINVAESRMEIHY